MSSSDRCSPLLDFSIYTAGLMVPFLALLAATVIGLAADEDFGHPTRGSAGRFDRNEGLPRGVVSWSEWPNQPTRAPPFGVRGPSSEQNGPRRQAQLANDRASEWLGQGKYREAVEAATQALDLARSGRFVKIAADAHQSLGFAYLSLGDFESAIAHYEKLVYLLEFFRDPHSLAVARHNLGVLLNSMGRWQEAADTFSKALESLSKQADPEALAAAKSGLALALFQLDKPGWRPEIEAALELQRKQGDLRALVSTLDRMAILAVEEGHFDEAEARFSEALEIHQRIGDPHGEALLVGNRGWMEVRRGNAIAGLIDLRQALQVFKNENHQAGQAFVLLGCAQARQKLGQLVGAFADAEEAIALLENLRTQLRTPLWRMVYLDHRINYFDTYVEVAMALHRKEPSAGHDLEALAASEAARGRGLLDLLGARYAGAAFASEAPFRPQPFPPLAQMREADSVFLVYYFSEDRGYLWSLGPNGRQTFDLGPTPQLAGEVKKVYELLSAKGWREQSIRPALTRLSHQLLPPTALPIGAKRLVVVGDGPIRFVPFALLPSPLTGEPLVAEQEISYLPSLSTLAALRSVPVPVARPEHQLAVVADPQLLPPPATATSTLKIALRSGGIDELESLPNARIEAQNLLALAPAEGRLAIFGTAASRETILSGFLAPYRYIHFATHGLFDPVDVRRSGLVLSAYDAQGGKLDAFLSFSDIEKTRLSADLVVGSACDTAMGKNLRGEGPVGVSQAFLAAGARRTIGSLWQIDDRATVEFMTELYRSLLIEKLAPAAALRKTQLKFLGDDPYRQRPHWAAFVLLGEYL